MLKIFVGFIVLALYFFVCYWLGRLMVGKEQDIFGKIFFGFLASLLLCVAVSVAYFIGNEILT